MTKQEIDLWLFNNAAVSDHVCDGIKKEIDGDIVNIGFRNRERLARRCIMTIQRANLAPVSPVVQDKIDFARQKQILARKKIRKVVDGQYEASQTKDT